MPDLGSRQRANSPTSQTPSQPPKSGRCPSNGPTQLHRTPNCRTARTRAPQKTNTGSARVTAHSEETSPLCEQRGSSGLCDALSANGPPPSRRGDPRRRFSKALPPWLNRKDFQAPRKALMDMDCQRIGIIENKAFIPEVAPREPALTSTPSACRLTNGRLEIVQLLHSFRFQIKNRNPVLAANQYPVAFQRISRQHEERKLRARS